MEKVFKVLVLIASWISQRDKSNKQPQQASFNSWLQLGLPFEAVYDSKIFSYSVETRTDPDQLGFHKSASLDL